MSACRSGLRARGIWLVALVAAATVGVLVAGSPQAVHASDPPGDCWGGALSAEPLHCYILEEAQRAGVIEVAAVYQSPPDHNYLYVYVSHPKQRESYPWVHEDSVGAFFKTKASEFVERWPERVFFDPVLHYYCEYDRASAADKARCVVADTIWSAKAIPGAPLCPRATYP